MPTYLTSEPDGRSLPNGSERRPMALGLAGAVVVAIFTFVSLSGGPPGAVGGLRAATISFTAMVAGLTAIVSWTLVLLYDRLPHAAMRAGAIMVALLAWMIGSLFFGGGTRQGLQFIVVQVAFGGSLLLAATARRVVGGDLDIVVARCIRVTAGLLILAEIAGAIDPNLKIGVRPSAIVALIGVGWFLAEYRVGRVRSLWWALAALLGIAISLSRGALLAGFVLVVLARLLASGKHQARNVLLSVLVLITGYWMVTSWAPLRDRFTQGDVSLSIGGLNINAEGRTHVWAILWKEARADPFIGHGSGAASARSLAIDPAFDHPHNDYLRVFYDFGLVGITLMSWFAIRSARLLRRVRKRQPRLVAPLAALNAGLAVVIVMATDNPLDYSFVMIPLGALIGIGLGAGWRADRAQRTAMTTAVIDEVRVPPDDSEGRSPRSSEYRPSR